MEDSDFMMCFVDVLSNILTQKITEMEQKKTELEIERKSATPQYLHFINGQINGLNIGYENLMDIASEVASFPMPPMSDNGGING